MASAKQQGPASVDEGLNSVAQAITATLTAPDATNPQVHEALMQMMKMTLGVKQIASGKGGPPGGQQPGGQGQPGMQGGGTNLRQMMGGQPSAPSAGMGGGPSSTGMSADDLRGAVADQAS